MAQIRLVTEVPGPKSREMKARHERFVARGLTLGFPAFIREAQGAMLTDVDGNRFVDLAGGVGVMNLGYSDEDVLGAAREQLRRFVHTDYTVAPYGIDTKVAERLVGLIKGAGKAAFFNSGSEAVENSMKMARAYTGRKAIISFEGGFHGRTWMALSLTSKTMPYKQGFLPLAPEVYRLPYAYPYRPPVEPRAGESFGEACAALLDKTFVQIVAAKDVAALIVEPVQGEGGFVVPPEDYLPALKKRCEEHGIVFIADEVQTVSAGRARCLPSSIPGSSRTSSSWRSPSRRECRSRRWSAGPRSWTPRSRGGIGGTYPGNPVALASAAAVLDKFEDGELLRRSREIGERIRDRFAALTEKINLIGDVRRLGAMSAVEFVRDRETTEPAKEETAGIVRLAAARGVLALSAGVYGNCIRFLAPLVITDEQLDEALDVLEGCVIKMGRMTLGTARGVDAEALANPT